MKFIINFKINTNSTASRLHFKAETAVVENNFDFLMQLLALDEEFSVISDRSSFLIIFFLQVTQLKIVSNPFAKGFRDNDTNDE